jgi:acetyl esterase/lipase
LDAQRATFVGGVAYSSEGGGLRLDVLRPAEPSALPRPIALYIHGGGWRGGNRGEGMLPWLNPYLVRRGYVTASMTYRLSDEAPWPAQVDDVRAAIRWLRRHAAELGGDPARVGLWGYSAGAQLAAMAALTASGDEAVQAVALVACPADLRAQQLEPASSVAALLGSNATPEALDAISPVCHVAPGAPPFLVVQGTDDDIVPTSSGVLLCERLGEVGADAELVTLQGEDHEWLGRPGGRGSAECEGTFGSIACRFFDAHLRRQA